jgi:hypothetical protein
MSALAPTGIPHILVNSHRDPVVHRALLPAYELTEEIEPKRGPLPRHPLGKETSETDRVARGSEAVPGLLVEWIP